MSFKNLYVVAAVLVNVLAAVVIVRLSSLMRHPSFYQCWSIWTVFGSCHAWHRETCSLPRWAWSARLRLDDQRWRERPPNRPVGHRLQRGTPHRDIPERSSSNLLPLRQGDRVHRLVCMLCVKSWMHIYINCEGLHGFGAWCTLTRVPRRIAEGGEHAQRSSTWRLLLSLRTFDCRPGYLWERGRCPAYCWRYGSCLSLSHLVPDIIY